MVPSTLAPLTEPEQDSVEEMSREDVLLASAIIFFVAFFGLIFNMLGITVVLKNPILKNSFGSLCLSHSIANSGVLFVFFVYAAPATYIQTTNTGGMLNKLLGQLNILCWDACVYSHLVISFNRFFSIAIPARAGFIFSRRNTLVIIAIAWSIAFCHIFPYFWYDVCYIAYDPISWTWNYAPTSCGFIISTYTDYYTSVAIFITMSSVDFCTLVLLIIHRKHSRFASNEDAVKRRKVETRFFMQSCLQGALFFYEIFNFYYVSTLNTNQWFIFMTSTFAWEICHCLDGFVVVLFHFRRRIFTGDVSRTKLDGLGGKTGSAFREFDNPTSLVPYFRGTDSRLWALLCIGAKEANEQYAQFPTLAVAAQLPQLLRMTAVFSVEQYAETLLVAMLDFFIGFFGVILNCLSLLTLFTGAHFQNAYGALSFNHSCLNLSILLVYFLWVTPTTYVQSSETGSLFGKVVGQLFQFLWISLVYSHLTLSINRLVTLVFPRQTNSVFSYNSCIAIRVFIWAIGICHVIPLFWYEQCFVAYDPIAWIWTIGPSKCGQTYKLFVMQYWSLVVMAITLFINLVILLYAKLKSPISRRNFEMRAFMETATRSTAFLLTFLCSNVLGSVFTERWQKFVLMTLAWQAYHLFDGLMVVVLHFERKLLAGHREQHPVSFINVEHHPGHSQDHHHQHDAHFHHHFAKVDTI